MTLLQFVDRLKFRANEAVANRFITPDEYVWMINEAELWVAKKTGFYKKSKVFTFGEYVSTLGTHVHSYDAPADILFLDPDHGIKTGDSYNVNIIPQTIKNLYEYQRNVSDTGVYLIPAANIADGGAMVFFQYGNADRLSAGSSGVVFNFSPDVATGDQWLLSYCAKPVTHTALSESIVVPEFFHRGMSEYCIHLIKQKAGDTADSDYLFRKAEMILMEDRKLIGVGDTWQRKMSSPRRARGTYRTRPR